MHLTKVSRFMGILANCFINLINYGQDIKVFETIVKNGAEMVSKVLY